MNLLYIDFRSVWPINKNNLSQHYIEIKTFSYDYKTFHFLLFWKKYCFTFCYLLNFLFILFL